MFKKVLIANRGEIAVRIIRTCRDMGIETVAVYSTADKASLHTLFADEAVCIGPGPADQSYLQGDRIISAALATGAEAIHPGYGFLSEQADFAQAVEDAGLTFIGPQAQTIRDMGDKATARALAQQAGIPTVPGSPILESLEDARATANDIGYPVLLKATAGGGGKGMRLVHGEDGLEKAWSQATEEARHAFLDGRLYMEKCILQPKHVEVQILGDMHGHVVHFGDRDCSLQRNHQKMWEEAPCPVLTEQEREQIGQWAVQLAEEIGYRGLGTIEYIRSQEGAFYFIEMNTRLQVEHPVTEMIYGVDLVKEQIRVAVGLPLNMTQADLKPRGHAIECRINAEDPKAHFAPRPGRVGQVHLPSGPGVRVDTALIEDGEVSPYYDNLLAKVIVIGEDRPHALRRARRALSEFVIEDIDTNLSLHFILAHHLAIARGNYHTGFIEDHLEDLVKLL